jgi:pilus assembly protein CpaE
MRLQQLAHEVAPTARLYLATSGAVDARRSAVKVADVERTLKRKVDCQIPSDSAAVLSAVNFGKPLFEAAPGSAIIKALRSFVKGLDAPGDDGAEATGSSGNVLVRFAQGLKSKKK